MASTFSTSVGRLAPLVVLALAVAGTIYFMQSLGAQAPPPPPPPEPSPLSVTRTLSVSSDPSNGGRVEHECPAVYCEDRLFGSQDYLDGQTANITARPSSGYQFSHWSGAASGSSTSTSIRMDRDRSVTAHFVRIAATTYTLRAIADPSDGRGGYVDIVGGTLVTAGTKRFDQGEWAGVVAHSNSGWRFVRWSGNLSGSSNRETVRMNSNKTVTAHWEQIPATTYTLRAIAAPSDGRGGYVEISGGTSVTAKGTKRFNQVVYERRSSGSRSNSGWRFGTSPVVRRSERLPSGSNQALERQ